MPSPEQDRQKFAADLLERFVSDGRPEVAFSKLVAEYDGLVYSSALRQTEDRFLAEEVTQNVFAILARKAASLRKHGTLTAWIFQTTRLESAKAMRTERRRLRKLAALARETHGRQSESCPNDSGADDAWRDAVPLLDESLNWLPANDRQLIFHRFYEGYKFREIAAMTGRSEAACKMQLKRALAKLSRFFTARGVTVSVAAIGSELGAELARSSPAIVSIAPKALAASTSIPVTSLALNTIQTMSNLKAVALTSAALVAIVAVPLVRQETKAHSLRSALLAAQSQREAFEQSTMSRELDISPGLNQQKFGQGQRTIADLLAAADEPIDIETLLESMSEIMMNQDMLGMMRLMIPIVNLSAAEHSKLIADLEAHKGSPQLRQMTLQMISTFAPAGDAQESLERILKLGLGPNVYTPRLKQWAASDPAAAYAWYQEKLQAGDLAGTAVYSTPKGIMLGEILGSMARKTPDSAIEILSEIEDRQTIAQVVWKVAGGLGSRFKETGDDAPFQRLFEFNENRSDGSLNRKYLVNAALRTGIGKGEFDAGFAFARKYLEDDPADLRKVVAEMLRVQETIPFADRAEWLVASIPAEQAPLAMGELVNRTYSQSPREIGEWLDAQFSGAIRDRGFAQLAQSLARDSHHEWAFRSAQEVEDGILRNDAIEAVARSWMSHDSESARKVLPADLASKFHVE